MSEDGYYYDDYEYLEWNEGPYSAVDDLAEHTMHSPVWISYDPSLEMMEYESDWELSADEYYDTKVGEAKNKENAFQQSQQHGRRGKRRKLEAKEQIPDLSHDKIASVRQPVVWKALYQRLRSPELPTLHEGQTQKVALLKDWRDRLESKPPVGRPRPLRSRSRTYSRKQQPIEPDNLEGEAESDGDSMPLAAELPPTSLLQERSLSQKEQRAQAHMNGPTSTATNQAFHLASNVEANVTLTDEKMILREIVDEENQVSMNGKSLPKDLNTPEIEYTGGLSEHAADEKELPKRKRNAEDAVSVQPPPKRKKGRPKKTADAHKPLVMPASTGRKTRSKK